MKKNITIHDVAKHANVSIATVSNVINGTGRVSQNTLNIVNNSIDKLGYYPNISARTMKKKSSNLISVIVPFQNEKGNLHDNPFYWNLVSGIEKVSRKNKFQVVLTGVTGDNDLSLNFIKERNIDGVVIIGASHNATLVKETKLLAIPSVFVDSYLMDEEVYQVFLDDEQGGYKGIKFLLDQGHKHIALIGGNKEINGVMKERFEGAKKAFAQTDITIDESIYIDVPVSMEGGYDAGEIIINHPKITAIFCFSDVLAIGLMKYLSEKKKRIPDDYALIGFDNISASQYTTPPLTTISQNTVHKGEVTANLLIDQIMNNNDIKQKKIILPISLIERESTSYL